MFVVDIVDRQLDKYPVVIALCNFGVHVMSLFSEPVSEHVMYGNCYSRKGAWSAGINSMEQEGSE